MPKVRLATARRWAQAVFQIAREQDALDRWEQELEELFNALGDPDFRALLEDPAVPAVRKVQAVRERVPGVSPQAQNLLALLAVRRRLPLLPLILYEYRRMVDAHQGVVQVEVYSALPLDPGLQQRITRALEARTGHTVRAVFGVDPAILGGLVFRIGDTVIDASLRGRLVQMRQALVQTG